MHFAYRFSLSSTAHAHPPANTILLFDACVNSSRQNADGRVQQGQRQVLAGLRCNLSFYVPRESLRRSRCIAKCWRLCCNWRVMRSLRLVSVL
jgi:hypothetical protein